MAVLKNEDLNILKDACKMQDVRTKTSIYLPFLDRYLNIQDLLDTIDYYKVLSDNEI